MSTQNPHSGLERLLTVEQESGSLVGRASDARSFLSETAVQHGPLLAAVLLRDIGPQFSPVDGYTYLNDVRGARGLLSYNWAVPDGKSRARSYSASVYAGRLVDRSGAPHEVDVGGQAGVVLKSLLSLSVASDTSGLRTYEQAFPLYRGPAMHPFNATTIALGHGDGTPGAVDVTYSFGPFALFCLPAGPQSLACPDGGPAYADAFVRQLDVSVSRPLKNGYGVTAQYAGTIERPYAGTADGQWLRRISLTRSLGSQAQLALLARCISGSGGFSRPGLNAAVSYQRRLAGGNHVYMEYGSPDATATLQRVIVKLVSQAGAVPESPPTSSRAPMTRVGTARARCDEYRFPAPRADRATASLTFVGNATTLLRLNGCTLLTDPSFLHAGNAVHVGYGLFAKRLLEPALQPEQLPPLDAVLLSHLHGDHWDPPAERALDHALPLDHEPSRPPRR